MSAIVQALASGYSAQKILDFVVKKFPNLSSKVQKAQNFGYTVPQILNFLAQNHEIPSEAIRGLSESEVAGIQKKQETTRREKGALAAASLIPTLTAATSPVSAALSPSPQLPIGPQPMANAPVTPPQIPPVPQGGAQQAVQAAPAVAQTPPTVAPPVAAVSPASIQDSLQVIRDMGLEGKIKSLAGAGNSPEGIQAGVEATLTPGQKKWLGEKIKAGEAKAIGEMVKDYLGAVPASKQSLPTQKGIPFAGGRIVASPSGVVGEVKSEREKQALVQEGDSLKKVNRDEMFDVPEQLQNLDYRDMAKQYISSFPREGQGSLSSNVASLVYHAPSKELFASFVSSPGKFYRYRNIPSEMYEKIVSQSTAPKTSGQAFTGDWDAAIADSIGSPLREITQHPDTYPFEIFDVGYNMMGKLLDAIKEEHKEHEKNKRKQKAHPRGA